VLIHKNPFKNFFITLDQAILEFENNSEIVQKKTKKWNIYF